MENDKTYVRDGFSVVCYLVDGMWRFTLVYNIAGTDYQYQDTQGYRTHNAAFSNAQAHYQEHRRKVAVDGSD